jgi:hypothetical protein
MQSSLDEFNKNFNLNIGLDKWSDFINAMKPVVSEQLTFLEPAFIFNKKRDVMTS